MTPTTRRDDVRALLLMTAIVAVFFYDVLLGWNSLYLRDITQYYYPAKHVTREIVRGGEFPLWNPYFSAGQPLAANPEHEVFYPLSWLVLLPSYDLGFRLLIVLHLLIAAWTMYAFIRSLGAGPPAAFTAGLSFALGGLLLSCITLLPCLFVLAWLPLTCLFTRRYLRDGRKQDFALAALSLGMQVLVGEPTMVFQTGLLLGAYGLTVKRGVRRVALIVITACAVGAAMLIPGFDHARESVRADGFDFAIVTTWSMPFARIAELVYPNVLGQDLLDGPRLYWGARLYTRGVPFFMSIYAGLLIAVLAVAGLVVRRRGAALFAIIALGSVLLALGDSTPLWRFLYGIGLARSIRYPEKFVAMGVFALIVFAARVLDDVLRGDERTRKAATQVAIAIGAIAGLAFLIALTPWSSTLFTAIWDVRSSDSSAMLQVWRSGWLVALLRAALLVLILRNLPRIRRALWLSLGTLFVLLDLGLLLPEIVPRMPSAFFREPPKIAQQMPDAGGRLFHIADWYRDRPAFRPYFAGRPDQYWIRRNAMLPMIPAQWNVREVLELDYDLTALQATSRFTAAAWSLAAERRDWINVVAPMANITHLAVFADPDQAFARAGDNLREVQPTRVLKLGTHPRYFFAESLATLHGARFPHDAARGVTFIAAPAFVPAGGLVRGVRERANRVTIDVESAGRAFLVMSVTPHKYWNVTVDGRHAGAIVTNIGFQGVVIPTAGRHVVEMRYSNPLILIGAGISALTVLVLAFVAITMRGL